MRQGKGDSKRVSRIFVAALLFLTTITGILTVFTQEAAAATYTAAWIDTRTISLTVTNPQNNGGTRTDEYNFVDSNPNDSNRTFKGPLSGASAKCPADKPPVITLNDSPGSGKLFTISSAPSCTISSGLNISISAISSAQIGKAVCDPEAADNIREQCEARIAASNAAFARACDGPYASGPLCNATAAPPYAEPPAEPPTQDENREPHPCDSLGDFSLRWVTCPILTAGVEFADKADALIEYLLHYDEAIFNDKTSEGKNFKAAWNSFRTVGLSLMLIVGLIMVVSQAANLQIFDAYAFRKTLPRLLLAIIGIALSWEVLEFVIIFFNDMGHLIQDIVLSPFKNAADPTSSNPFAAGAGLGLVVSGALLGTLAGAITLGPLGIISLIITVFMAVMVGLFVLMTRTAIITMAILTAPLAIACWVLPGTKKVWDFWQGALSTALFIFPIIMLLIAAGKAMSFVTEEGIMKILFLILPYVLLPFAFRLAGGLMSTIFSLTNDKTRGAFDRMSNLRRGAVKSRMEDAINGTGKTWLSKNTGMARGVSGTLGNVYRRGHAIGQYGGIKGGFGATYAASRVGYGMNQVDEALKRDNQAGGSAGGNDDANEIAARRGMTSEKFLREYSSLLHRRDGVDEATAMQSARSALGTFESGYGVRMGSDTGRVVAGKALLASNTALKANKGIDWKEGDPEVEGAHYARAMETIGGLVADGLVDESQGAAIFKQNKMRNEFAQVGFGGAMKQIGYAAKQMKKDPSNRGMAVLPTDEREAEIAGVKTASQLTRETLRGMQPGQLVGGRHETIDAVAPEMLKVIQEAASSSDQDLFVRELAQTAGLHDSMSQGNRLNADRLEEHLLGQAITLADGRKMTVRQAIDEHRTNDTFMNRRREYGAAATAQAQSMNAPVPGQGPQPPPVIGG